MPLQPRSQKSYWACVCQLAEHFDCPPDQVNGEDLRQYFIHLKTERRFSRQSFTQALCAIKLFWAETFDKANQFGRAGGKDWPGSHGLPPS